METIDEREMQKNNKRKTNKGRQLHLDVILVLFQLTVTFSSFQK